MLQLLAEDRIAPGFERGGDNERVSSAIADRARAPLAGR
jgi:hypothetical protein